MFVNTITVPANNVYRHLRRGKVFVCISATAALKVRPDNEAPIPTATGRGFGGPSAEERNLLTFENTTANPIDVTFYWGLEDYRPDPSQVSASVTVTGQNSGSFANGSAALPQALATGVSSAAFPGTSGANIRKQFIVTNLNKPVSNPNADVPDVLWVLGANGNIVGVVFPQQSFTFEAGGSLTLHNPSIAEAGGALSSGNAVTFTVGEVYYS